MTVFQPRPTDKACPGLFDAHCDTVLKVTDGREFLQPSADRHVSWPQMIEADLRVQVFACFARNADHPGRTYERACEMLETVERIAEATDGGLRIARTGRELEEAFGGGPRAGILALEGADPLGATAENVREFFGLGVRSLIFAWSDNAFSGTANGSNTPLTGQGRRLLGLSEEMGIMVDVSHLSDAAFAEVARLADRPFVATHSNCRALCPSLRNLTDGMIRELADRGGVVGVNFSPAFLDPCYREAVKPLSEASRRPGVTWEEKQRLHERMRALPRPPLRWVVRHILHAMRVGGEDCVGLGADLDGIGQTPEGLDAVSDVPKLMPLLREAGVSERQLEKLCFRNFLRVYTEILPTV